jgi:hypothetical protein
VAQDNNTVYGIYEGEAGPKLKTPISHRTLGKVRVKEGDAEKVIEAPLHAINHAPEPHLVHIRFPRHLLQKMLIEGNDVEIVLDTSSTYDRGMQTVCEIHVPLPEGDEMRKVYFYTNTGKLVLAR